MISEQTDTHTRWVLPEAASDADREQHAIPAAEVAEALCAGRSVEIANAIVVGPLTLRSLAIPGKCRSGHCIRGPADWSYTTFRRVVNLEQSTFADSVSLRSATMEHDLKLDQARFVGQLNAAYLTIAGELSAQSATFELILQCKYATFKQHADFQEAVFAGASFFRARFEAGATFSKARFRKLASFAGTRSAATHTSTRQRLRSKRIFLCLLRRCVEF